VTKIRILPEILSNKIAAGEVVERPASVVKELVENAVDAGGTRIGVDIENGGRSLIRVSDNGHGMGHDDALLAIERYATSKILKDEDLYAIRTLGFRGEALPSIAAVSRLTLVTRMADDLSGTEIRVEGGRIMGVAEAGAPAGTMITVRQLFYNIPARRKFLKTVATEMGHIAEFISCMALARPDIQFKLVHNQKTVYNWPPVDDPADRVMAVLGTDLRSSLHRVDHDEGAVRIAGWTSDPDETRSTSQKIHIFVNGRYIKDRGIQYALFEGYRGRIMKGRFPVAVIFVTLPPGQVDVNVHPAKNEVRFAEPRQVYGAVRAAVGAVWEKQGKASWKRPDAETAYVRESIRPTFRQGTAAPSPVNRMLPFGPAPPPRRDHGIASGGPNVSDGPEPFSRPETLSKTSKTYETAEPALNAIRNEDPAHGNTIEPAPGSDAYRPPQSMARMDAPLRFGDLAVIGQFQNTYILCESADALFVVDQHAAHERIVFERLKTRHLQNTHPRMQQLVLPETIELGFKEAALLQQALGSLTSLGLEIDHFGGNTFAVKAVPALIADQPVAPLITDIAESLAAFDDATGPARAMEECLILMACHGAIRARQRLTDREIRELLAQLDACEDPFHCPHGRPTFARWSAGTIEKTFKRTG
jgi:DNA mismatch repair protein MutL